MVVDMRSRERRDVLHTELSLIAQQGCHFHLGSSHDLTVVHVEEPHSSSASLGASVRHNTMRKS